MFAGADTTASTLTAGFYHVLKNRRIYCTLMAALGDANLDLPIQYDDVKDIPYFEAVILEILCIHPAVGMLLERVVPPAGFTLSNGVFLPGGVYVGINPWVINMNKEIFGPDVESFCPDRWLKMEEETQEDFRLRLKAMKQTMLTFGGGNRVCLGKPMALVELNKIIATIFLTYEVGMTNVLLS